VSVPMRKPKSETPEWSRRSNILFFSCSPHLLAKRPVIQDSITNWTPGPVYRYQENFKPLSLNSITTFLRISQTLLWTVRGRNRRRAFIFALREDFLISAYGISLWIVAISREIPDLGGFPVSVTGLLFLTKRKGG
jgi:hypothetical protein